MGSDKILIVDSDSCSGKEFHSHLSALNYSLLPLCANLEMVRQVVFLGIPSLAVVRIDLSTSWEGLIIAQWLLENLQVESLLIAKRLNEELLEKTQNLKHLGILLFPYKLRNILPLIDNALYRKALTVQLREKNRLLGSLMASDSDALLLVSHEHRILSVNPSFIKLSGGKENELIGKTIREILVLKTYEESLIHCDETLFDFFNQKQLILQDIYFLSPFINHSPPVEICFLDVNTNPVKLVIRVSDLSRERSLERDLAYSLSHDSLTGFLNRSSFFKKLENFFSRSLSSEETHVLMYLDIDRFRSLNENLGEAITNNILREVTNILQESVSYSSENMLARLGTDDFAIFLQNTSTYRALELAWLIKRKIADIDLSKYESVIKMLPLSIGLARFERSFKSASSMLSAAQSACLIAKNYGGNQIKIFEAEEEIFRSGRSKLFWISSLSKALDNNLFQLFYQRIMPLKEGLLPKIEVLLRFYNEEGERVSPQEFILIAESNGMMPDIDKWVIRNALAGFHAFNKVQEREYIFSINISAETIKRAEIVDFILQEIETYKIPPQMVYFEITETALIENINVVKKFITQLKEADIGCSLDDFGNGYTSFSSLKELPVEVLKVDGLFIRNITSDQVSQAVVHALRQLTEAMNILMVAEFIENEEILEIVKRLGSDYGQGYLWGAPKPLFDNNRV